VVYYGKGDGNNDRNEQTIQNLLDRLAKSQKQKHKDNAEDPHVQPKRNKKKSKRNKKIQVQTQQNQVQTQKNPSPNATKNPSPNATKNPSPSGLIQSQL
jgi:hypothetical protein